jgi:hypothetical protein
MFAKKKKPFVPPSRVNKPEQRQTKTTEEQNPAQSSGITTQQTGKCEEKKEEKK